MEERDSSYAHLGVTLGEDARIHCATYSDRGPILSLGGSTVFLSVYGAHMGVVTASDLANARALAEAASTFLAECERLAEATDTSGDSERAA